MNCTEYPARNSASTPIPQLESVGMLDGGGAAVVVMVQLLAAVFSAVSTTLAAKEALPPVGVPATTPVEAVRFKPGGSGPVMENVKGGVPPVATSKELYGTPI